VICDAFFMDRSLAMFCCKVENPGNSQYIEQS
jgi:hypothetical protein